MLQQKRVKLDEDLMKCHQHSNTKTLPSVLLVLAAPVLSLETLAPSCVLSLKHDCSTTKCRIQGNVISNWYSSCPAHLLTARCGFPASLGTCSLFHLACLVLFIWFLLDMDLSCHPLATKCLILTSCVTSQPTACQDCTLHFWKSFPKYIINVQNSLEKSFNWITCWRNFPSERRQTHYNLWPFETGILSHRRHFTDVFGAKERPTVPKSLSFLSNCI